MAASFGTWKRNGGSVLLHRQCGWEGFNRLGLGIGEEGESIMKKESNWEMPVGKLTRVRDFLPPPSQLVIKEETAKVTIALEKSSVDFFKRQAKKNHTKYQRMIRELLDQYASHYSRAA